MSQDRDARTPGYRSVAPSRDADVFARTDVFSSPAVRQPEGSIVRDEAFDPARIMASIGEAPYEWTIESDVLAWGANATDVLTVAEWVQDEPSAQLLTEWGCDYLQGVLIGLASVERPWGDAVQVDRRKTPRT